MIIFIDKMGNQSYSIKYKTLHKKFYLDLKIKRHLKSNSLINFIIC